VLAPAALAHLERRFAPYPIKVALLNASAPAAKRKTDPERAQKAGPPPPPHTVELWWWATHQLLGKGTSFEQLGLLVVG